MKYFKQAVWFVLILVIAAVVFAPFCIPAPAEETREERILRIWNIDTFEGGTGSRTAFLKSTALTFGKKYNVHFLVNSVTPEAAQEAFQTGNLPDLISFGTGVSCVADYAVHEALPWCMGRYCLFSKGDAPVLPENTIVSEQSYTLSAYSASFLALASEPRRMESVAAYVTFLQSDSYLHLLGTQRDIYRFRTRGAEVNAAPVTEFTDLIQYIAILTEEEGDASVAAEFCSYLLSDEVQKNLTGIGLFSPYITIYPSGDPMHALETEATVTVSPYLNSDTISALNGSLWSEGGKVLGNYLKGIDKSRKILYNKGE